LPDIHRRLRRVGRSKDVIILMALLLAGCGNKETVLSSRTSPNGSMVAENVLVDHGGPADEGTSHLIIRNAQAKKGYDEELNEPAADLFLRWTDESHLEVWREGASCDPHMPEMMGDVHIVCRSYVFPDNAADTYRRPGIPAETIAVPAGNVAARFDRRSSENGWSCVLSIETGQDASHDSAKVEITVGVSNSCKRDRGRPCAGISTRFSLGNRHGTVPQTMLTSATIADIPSYNRLPEGSDGTMIRGQFLERNAVTLIERLKAPSIAIEYSRDFFDQVLRYDVPLTGHAKTLAEFDTCVGDADLLWVRHS
jgi:hypothetical protein